MNIPNNFASIHAAANFASSQLDSASPAQLTFRTVMKQLQSKPLKLSATQLYAQARGEGGLRSVSQQVFQDTAGALR